MALFIGQDEELTCKDCGAKFIFTQGEQKFFDEQGFTDKPKRCKPCRIAKKAQKAQQMGSDQQPRFPSDSNYPPQQNYGGNGNGNGNGRSFRGRTDSNSRGNWDDRGSRRNSRRDDY